MKLVGCPEPEGCRQSRAYLAESVVEVSQHSDILEGKSALYACHSMVIQTFPAVPASAKYFALLHFVNL